MRTRVKVYRTLNRVLDVVTLLIVGSMLLYGIYSLWDNYQINHRAFVTDELLKYKPTPEHTESLSELLAMNPDVVGWLTIDGTHIDYPMVQGKTDLEYINKDVHGDFALSGAIFLSCLNERDFSDHYNVIYGHHMDNGAMFGDVLEFVADRFFDTHTTGTLYTLDRTMKIEIFACLSTQASDRYVYDPSLQEEGISSMLSYLQENAVQYRDIGLTADDTIVGLSTCSDAITNGRVILYGRLGDPVMSNNGGVSGEHENEENE